MGAVSVINPTTTMIKSLFCCHVDIPFVSRAASRWNTSKQYLALMTKVNIGLQQKTFLSITKSNPTCRYLKKNPTLAMNLMNLMNRLSLLSNLLNHEAHLSSRKAHLSSHEVGLACNRLKM